MRKKYSEMTKAEKRVTIAKDVLAQIKLKRYIPLSGSYIEKGSQQFKDDVDIKKSFKKIKECEVCAMGACLLSITKFENKLTWGDVGGGIQSLTNSKVIQLFKKTFSPEQLLLIEDAFERASSDGDRVGKIIFGLSNSKDQVFACDEFYFKYRMDDERMIAIMQNIIANKGTFKPEAQ